MHIIIMKSYLFRNLLQNGAVVTAVVLVTPICDGSCVLLEFPTLGNPTTHDPATILPYNSDVKLRYGSDGGRRSTGTSNHYPLMAPLRKSQGQERKQVTRLSPF